ncbi:hypothetical protein [Robbsia sp. KACC 23696]|uniref:hypothetical protein n=1 Tax=Robbsia sp. KACC 23696 TaxID=3149231 RepID=UPI00325AADD9
MTMTEAIMDISRGGSSISYYSPESSPATAAAESPPDSSTCVRQAELTSLPAELASLIATIGGPEVRKRFRETSVWFCDVAKGTIRCLAITDPRAISSLKISRYRSLKQLIVNNIGFGLSPDSARTIAEVLRGHRALTSLNLRNASLGFCWESTQAIAVALSENDTLTSINLSYNWLGPCLSDCVRAIAGALRMNSSLTSVDLSANYLGSSIQVAEAIAGVLRENTSLTSIDLRGNGLAMHPKAISTLSAALRENSTLKSVDLRWNQLEKPDRERLTALSQEIGKTILL